MQAGRGAQNHQIVGMAVTEQRPGALLEHIRVEAVGPQEHDVSFQTRALGRQVLGSSL